MGYIKNPLEITITPIGDWDGAMRQMMGLDERIKKALMSAQYVLGRQILNKVKGHIKNQDLGWPPLAQSTINRKGHDTILVDTFNYYENIKFWQEKLIVYIGVKKGVQEKNGMETSLVATFHEYGTADGRVPRRPLWLPTLMEMGGPKGIRDKITKGVGEYFQRQGYSLTWQ